MTSCPSLVFPLDPVIKKSGFASSSFLFKSRGGIEFIPPGLEGLRRLAETPSVPVTLSPLAQSSPVIFKPADWPSPVILD